MVAARNNPQSYKYMVTDNTTGKKYKSLSVSKASEKAGLDPNDTMWSVEEHGRADSDTHSVKPQSRSKSGFAFR